MSLRRWNGKLVQEFVDEPGYEVLFDPGCCPHTIFPNTIVPMFEDGSNPYRDLRVRQAMNHAVDVETIYTTLATGREQRAYGIGTRQLGGMQPEQSGSADDGVQRREGDAVDGRGRIRRGIRVRLLRHGRVLRH